MGRSADEWETTLREEAALDAAMEAARSVPAAWLELSPGRALRRLRKRLGLRQDELAAALGMRQSTVSKIERGLDARWSTLSALCREMGCRLAVVPVSDRDLEALRALARVKRLRRLAEGRAALERLAARLESARRQAPPGAEPPEGSPPEGSPPEGSQPDGPPPFA